MVNSSDPSNNCASLRSHRHHRNNPPSETFSDEIFRQPQLRRVDTPPRLPKPAFLVSGRISGNRCPTRHHAQNHSPPLSLTRRRVRAHGFFSSYRTSSLATNLSLCTWFSYPTPTSPLLSIFLSSGIYFQPLLDFSSKSDTIEAPLTFWSCFVPSDSIGSVDSTTLSYFSSLWLKKTSLWPRNMSLCLQKVKLLIPLYLELL